MTIDQFEETLRQFLRREPFEPFEVVLNDGTIIEINRPKVAFGGGAATFIAPGFELVEFVCENTRAIRPSVKGVAS